MMCMTAPILSITIARRVQVQLQRLDIAGKTLPTHTWSARGLEEGRVSARHGCHGGITVLTSATVLILI